MIPDNMNLPLISVRALLERGITFVLSSGRETWTEVHENNEIKSKKPARGWPANFK